MSGHISSILEQNRSKFEALLEEPKIKEILESQDFYFQKAVDKYNEYLDMTVPQDVLSSLIDRSKEKPFSYKTLLEAYSSNSIEGQVLRVIGELISYIDKNAAMKNELNRYGDKRTLALAFVRQNVWVQSLLGYKLNNDSNTLPEVVHNAFKYLSNPLEELTVLKQEYKNNIINSLGQGDIKRLFEALRAIGFCSNNPMNDGCVYSMIFYTEGIKELWFKTKEQEADEAKEKRTWSYAPGENGHKWDEFRENGIMAIGWDDVGDLRDYKNKKEISDQINEIYGSVGYRTNDSLCLWQFCNEIQVGDKIIAKAGGKTVLGVGEVVSHYEYDDTRDDYRHVRKVKWTRSGKWVIEDKFAIKTLTDITPFEEFCRKIDQITEKQGIDKITTVWGSYSKQDFLSEVFIPESQYDTMVSLLKRKKNLILQGAPGVGKTFAAKRLAYSILGQKDETRVKMVQFHQSYSYEDFIMGYRPDDTGFSLKYGAFHKFCKQAEQNPGLDFFFIIDEINRGNLSKIFGELLMLIEADKRGEKMMLTYEDTEFSVPENFYIIGMMNTADRSLAIIDYALRRRFCFVELEPAFETEIFKQYLLKRGLHLQLVDKIMTKFKHLNKQIQEDTSLGGGFRIGHSYFCDCSEADDNWYQNIIRYEVAPLLEEYWFDELDKAQQNIKELLG